MSSPAYVPPEIQRMAVIESDTFPHDAVVVADRRLPEPVLRAFPDPILVEAGERLKSLASIEELATSVLRRRSSKPLTLVAVGGGSVGDAVGFLASILWRGVTLWQVPTTLLAMVDSAHGGKTAVNLGSAKNQLGTFYPASRILIVEQFLSSLPVRQRREGVVELLKALWLGDAGSVHALNTEIMQEVVFAPWSTISAQLGNMIETAVSIKHRIVSEDPREEEGVRTVLNLGHTLGHALELVTGLGHGASVAWGMAASLRFSERFGMSDRDMQHCRATLLPLLVPIGTLPSREVLHAAMLRDKKRSHGTLRSVLLHAPGDPHVHTDISADDWIDALEQEVRQFQSSSLRVSLNSPRNLEQTLDASKSELNRALIIAAQRKGRSTVVGKSAADDVRSMTAALQQLGYPLDESEKGFVSDRAAGTSSQATSSDMRTVHAGEGGTTLRFLLALCATSRTRTKIVVAPALMRRPHESLINSLRSAGAAIERFDDLSGQGFVVQGWEQFPASFSVDVAESSQYASAIALLAAGSERPFTLRLMGEPVSPAYFELTLAMLEQAGVDVIRKKSLIALNPTTRLEEKLTMDIQCDASSRAVWSVAHFLGHPAEPGRKARVPRQPDSEVDQYLSQLREARRKPVELDLHAVPDLLPVLAVAAVTVAYPVRFTGVAHLRFKESDRLDGLAASLRAVGINAVAEEAALRIDPGHSIRPGSMFETQGDHRLVMAAVLLTLAAETPLIVTRPWTVSKSYPAFWDDVRAGGWLAEAVEDDRQG
ncbi:hypothetical protein KQI65_10595 [bacterium]|nr:hypothetical protein [bacterium]